MWFSFHRHEATIRCQIAAAFGKPPVNWQRLLLVRFANFNGYTHFNTTPYDLNKGNHTSRRPHTAAVIRNLVQVQPRFQKPVPGAHKVTRNLRQCCTVSAQTTFVCQLMSQHNHRSNTISGCPGRSIYSVAAISARRLRE